MAEFNAMDTAAFKGVWVFCEQREGEIQSISYQLLSEGRKLANDLGVELAGVVMGSGLAEADLKTLGGYGADRVYNIDSPLLKDYTTDGYAKALCDLIMDKKPEIMLIGATNLGRDLGPRCAARLHTGLTADCTHLDVDVEKYKNFLRTTSNIDVDNTKFEENTNLKMTRPAFGGVRHPAGTGQTGLPAAGSVVPADSQQPLWPERRNQKSRLSGRMRAAGAQHQPRGAGHLGGRFFRV